MATPALPQYLWLVITGAFAAFGFAWGTGSNDGANAFATSVGAKTLTLKQAIIIASIFEFGGAMLLGRVSTNTIAGKIANPAVFASDPAAYAYGMVCALTTSFVWQSLCSYWELNVSSTHTIIASIIGFSMVWGGPSAVNWYTWDPNLVPPFAGVVPILMSWIISPIFTGAAACLILYICRTAILRRKHAVMISIWTLPVVVALTAWINVFFVFTKGAKKTLEKSEDAWSVGKSAWVSAAISGGLGLIVAATACPILMKRVKNLPELPSSEDAAGMSSSASSTSSLSLQNKDTTETDITQPHTAKERLVSAWKITRTAVMHGVNVDVHQAIKTDPLVKDIHKNAERFDPKAEYVFGWLQVFSAICVIFAHGASEVGFMAGPLSTIYQIYMYGTMPTSVQPQIWVILIGAGGLVIGLATYGYKLIAAMGTKMAMLSPSRGFAAELATALVILVTSQFGLPTSSSQCITGAIVGVGLMEGAKRGVNWKFFARQFAAWVATVMVAAVATAGLFAQGVYSPSKLES